MLKNLPNYTKVCAECAFHDNSSGTAMCTLPRDLVSGKVYRLSCVTCRMRIGHCGPGGRNFTAGDTLKISSVVTMERRNRKRRV